MSETKKCQYINIKSAFFKKQNKEVVLNLKMFINSLMVLMVTVLGTHGQTHPRTDGGSTAIQSANR